MLESKSRSSAVWPWMAAAVGAGTVLLWSLRGSSETEWFSGPIPETDFDSFLVAQTGERTGLPPKSSKKKRGAAREKKTGSFFNVRQEDRGNVSGPFESFLRVENVESGEESEEEDEDPRNPLDFNSFLKTALPACKKKSSANGEGAGKQALQIAAKKVQPSPLPHQSRVLVMFGTEYGFSKEIAEKLFNKLSKHGDYWPVLVDMADHTSGYDFSKEQALLIACSTQGDGVPPTEAREFCDWLISGKGSDFKHLSYSVCALGDRSYTHFCRCGKQLDAALEAAGASQLAPRQDVNKEDWEAVDAWVELSIAGLKSAKLKPLGEEGVAALTVASGASKEGLAPKKWGKSNPYPATVIAVEGLCAVSGKDDKNTYRVELDLGDSGLTYQPGDALGIYPRNAPQYVEELIALLGADGTHPVPTPSWHYAQSTPRGPGHLPEGNLTLSEALTSSYDLRSPKPELFQLLLSTLPKEDPFLTQVGEPVKLNGHANGHVEAHVHAVNGASNKHMPVSEQASTLSSLITGGVAAQEAYLSSGRHVVDILRELSCAPLSVPQVLGTLRQLQPRLYSISSSPLEGSPNHVQATIAEVKYEAHGWDRVGVCSTYVSERIKVGFTMPVYIHKNPDFRLPSSHATPIIMVGPGTGLAPFRSFILQRLIETGVGAQGSAKPGKEVEQEVDVTHSNGNGTVQTQEDVVAPATKEAPFGQMVLYFGCRRADQDYLYGSDLEQWAAQGDLTLFTAFSRQQSGKVYVQDRLKSTGSMVWKLLQEEGAHFYVCGDASRMAGDVEKVLLDIIAEGLQADGNTEGGVGNEAAARYLEEMSEGGRYQRDVWW